MPCAGVNTPRSEAPLARRFRHTCVWAMSRGAWPRTLPATWTRSVCSGSTCIFLRGGTCRCAVGLKISTCNNNMPSCRSRYAGALATLVWHDAVVHAQFNANCVSLVLVSLGACRSAAARTRRAAAADGRGTPGGGARSYLRAGAVAEFRVRRRPGTSRPRTCVRGQGRRLVNLAIGYVTARLAALARDGAATRSQPMWRTLHHTGVSHLLEQPCGTQHGQGHGGWATFAPAHRAVTGGRPRPASEVHVVEADTTVAQPTDASYRPR